MRPGASWPCTGVGNTITSTCGDRRAIVVSTSRSAAACVDVTTPITRGMARQRLLARRVEQARRLERGLDAQELLEQHPGTGTAHLFDLQLEVAPRRIDPRQDTRLDAVALARRPVDALVTVAEHHAAHLRVAVLHREVPMPGRRARQVRQLAGDPRQREGAFEEHRDLAHQFADRHDAGRGCGTGESGFSAHAGFQDIWSGFGRPAGTYPHAERPITTVHGRSNASGRSLKLFGFSDLRRIRRSGPPQSRRLALHGTRLCT